MADIIKTYIDELDRDYRTGKSTEHSHRPALKRLLESMLDGVQASMNRSTSIVAHPTTSLPEKTFP